MSGTFCSCSYFQSDYTGEELTAMLKEFAKSMANDERFGKDWGPTQDLIDEGYSFSNPYDNADDQLKEYRDHVSLDFENDDSEGSHDAHKALAVFISMVISTGDAQLTFECDGDCWGYHITKGVIRDMAMEWVTRARKHEVDMEEYRSIFTYKAMPPTPKRDKIKRKRSKK